MPNLRPPVHALAFELHEHLLVVWNEVLVRIHLANEGDLNEAFHAARYAQPNWCRMLPAERSKILRRAADDRLSETCSTSIRPITPRLRSLVHKAFTPSLVEQIRLRIQTVANELIDVVSSRREKDLVKDFALPLPMTSITGFLGVPTKPLCQIRRNTGTSIGCGFKLRRMWYGISYQHNNAPDLVSDPSPVRGMCGLLISTLSSEW